MFHSSSSIYGFDTGCGFNCRVRQYLVNCHLMKYFNIFLFGINGRLTKWLFRKRMYEQSTKRMPKKKSYPKKNQHPKGTSIPFQLETPKYSKIRGLLQYLYFFTRAKSSELSKERLIIQTNQFVCWDFMTFKILDLEKSTNIILSTDEVNKFKKIKQP